MANGSPQKVPITHRTRSINHVETPHSFGHSPGRLPPSRGPKLSPHIIAGQYDNPVAHSHGEKYAVCAEGLSVTRSGEASPTP